MKAAKYIFVISLLVFGIIGLLLFMSKEDRVVIGVLGDYLTADSSASFDTYEALAHSFELLNLELGEDRYQLIQIDLTDIKSAASLEKNIMDNHIDILVGPSSSGQTKPVVSYLQKVDVPVFPIGVSLNDLSEQKDNVFRLVKTITEQAKEASDVVTTYFKTDLTILYTEENSAFSEAFAQYTAQLVGAGGYQVNLVMVGDLLEDRVQRLILDYSYEDTVFIIAGPGEGGIISGMISLNNPDITLLMPAWASSQSTYEHLVGIPNETYFLTSPFIDDDVIYKDFYNVLVKEQGKRMTIFSELSIEVAYFIHHVLDNVESIEVESFKAYIHRIDDYQGKFYTFYFDDTGDGGWQYSLYRFVNGTLEKVTE